MKPLTNEQYDRILKDLANTPLWELQEMYNTRRINELSLRELREMLVDVNKRILQYSLDNLSYNQNAHYHLIELGSKLECLIKLRKQKYL